jgi:predicted 2-oxoglutarate/Fe(II)-dependent dioxygenase YbiX
MAGIKTRKMPKSEVNLLKKRVIVVKGVLDPGVCDRILKMAKKATEWVPAQVGTGAETDRGVRNCDVLPLSNPIFRACTPERTELDSLIHDSAGAALRAYVNAFPEVAESITIDTGYELLRYKKGGFYHQHVDSFTHQPRALSLSFAINDDYEGGEWGFFDGQHNLKLAKGDAVLFPSNSMFPHEICKVTKGTRYSIITWFR